MLTGVLGIAKAFAYAKVLGSEALGYYALSVVFSSYWQSCAELGICRGLECRLPTLYGSGSFDEGHRLRDQAAAALLALTAVLLPLLAVILAVLPTAVGPARSVFLLAGMMSSATLFVGLVAVDLRSAGRLGSLGWMGCWRTLGNVSVGVTAAVTWGVPGLLIAESLVAVAVCCVYARRLASPLRWRWDSWQAVRALAGTGLPVAGRNLLNSLCRTLDRWCVPLVVGMVEFGQYAFAMLVVSAGNLVFTAVWSHVGPLAARQFGRDRDLSAALGLLTRWACLLGLVAVALWLPFVWTTRTVVAWGFGQYSRGGDLMAILYWGGALQTIALFDWIAMAVERTRPLLAVTVLGTLVTVGCYLAAIQQRVDVETFAWIFVLGRALNLAGQYALGWALVRGQRQAAEVAHA
jgi:O-antigen/teichoic acid export membrane protein